MKKQLLWLALLIVLIASCKKKDPEPTLPPETQTGANTFGCMLNGQVWTNSPREGGGIPTLEAIPEAGGLLTIKAIYKYGERGEIINFLSQNINSTGVYSWDNKTSVRFEDMKKGVFCASYENDVTVQGLLTITRFDISNRVVSGRFHFKLQKQNGLTFEATEGRFDLQMN